MAAWMHTPNEDDKCCEEWCSPDHTGPCDPCECICGQDLPEFVVVVTYSRETAGTEGCKREVYLVTDCQKVYLDECDKDGATYTGGPVYIGDPISKWKIGGAVAVADGCSGLYGEYKQNGRLKYQVQTAFPAATGETIVGGFVENSGCTECEQIVEEWCEDYDCETGPPEYCGGQPCDCGSGVAGSGCVGSGTYDQSCSGCYCPDGSPCSEASFNPNNPPPHMGSGCCIGSGCLQEDNTCSGVVSLDCDEQTKCFERVITKCDETAWDPDTVPDSGCP